MPNYRQVNSAASKVLKAVLLISGIAIGVILLIVIFKAIFIIALFKFFISNFSTVFGMDSSIAMLFSLLATVASLVCAPWLFMFLAFGRYKEQVFFSFLIAFFVLSILVIFFLPNTYFNRHTGLPQKFYVKTLEGFKLSSTEDWDPIFNIKYKPMSEEIAKEYYFWKKTGKLQNIPEVEPGKYFDLLTGTPITWYVRRSDGSIYLSSLPGYDQVSGRPLLPMTEKLGDSLNVSQVMIEPKMNLKSEENVINLFTYQIKGQLWELDSLPVWQKEIMKVYTSAKEIYPVIGNEIFAEDFDFWYGTKKFKISLEKIISLSSNYTVFGLLFYGSQSNHNVKVNHYLITPYGEKLIPKFIHIDKQALPKNGRIENLCEGEMRRVLYVFDHISTDSLSPGELYFEDMKKNDESIKENYKLTYSKK